MEITQNILLVIHTNTYFPNFLHLAQLINQSSDYNSIIVFAQNYPQMIDDQRKCSICQIEYVTLQDVQVSVYRTEEHKDHSITGAKRKFINRLKSYLAWRLQEIRDLVFLYHILKLKRRIKLINALLGELKPKLLVLPADNRYDQGVFVRIAKRNVVKTVVIPSFMAGVREWAEFVWKDSRHSGTRLLNRFVGICYPRWTLNYREKRITALPAAQIIAIEWLRLAPPLPWVLHSGYADAILLECEAVKEYCLEEGLPDCQLKVTGSLTHDLLEQRITNASMFRSEFCKDHQLPNRPILLCALPYNCHDLGGGRAEFEFLTYEDLVQFWIDTLVSIAADKYNVVIALHPTVPKESMEYIEQWGCKITSNTTAEVIGICDIFVASISATIQWAIACSKPVVNYDVYQFNYTDYQNEPAVLNVFNKRDFASCLERLVRDTEYFVGVSQLQASRAANWGILDGKAAERIMDSIDYLTNANS